MNVRRLLSVILLFSTAIVHADDEVFKHPVSGSELLRTFLVEPSKALSNSQLLKAQFTQKRYLSEIPQPLIANGELIFVRDDGVYWHTLRPFDSVFVLTQAGILQRDEGVETLRLSADAQPAVRVIANIFFALFTLDVTALNGSFDLYGRKLGRKWTVGMVPKSVTVAGVFKQAIVSGGESVEQVVFSDKRGDRTVIDFDSLNYSREVPAEIRALFTH